MGKIVGGIVVILVMYFTCPTQEDHRKAVADKVSEFLERRASEECFERGFSEDPGVPLYMGMLRVVAYESVEVHDYKNWWIFSTAKIKNKTTFGIFDHVFIIDN